MNEVLGEDHVQCAYDKPIDVQIKELLYNISDNKVQKATLWGYFKKFQSTVQDRERIPKLIVEK